MGFNSYPEMAAAWNAGQKHQQHIHKTATPLTTGAGYWADLSMAAGTPKYNAYVGNQYEFTPMVGASNFGINAGLPGYDKFLTRLNLGGSGVANSAFPGTVILCDYVGFYPLVDMDSTDYQEFDNTALVPRHTEGLRLMVVCTTPQNTGTPILGQIVYLDSSGVEHVAAFYVQAANVGMINNFSVVTAGVSGSNPFVKLDAGSHDIQRVLGVTMFNSAGGFASFVLVKPLVNFIVPDSITPHEFDMPIHHPPGVEVKDGAYLNMLYCPIGTGAATGIIRGCFSFVRSS